MNFNKTTEYSLRIISFIALGDRELYSAGLIYRNLRIPLRYLRKQLTDLAKSGLIESIQGKNGGYRLSKGLNEISLLDIIYASGEKGIQNECFFGFKSCTFEKKCALHDKWVKVRKDLSKILSSTTLEDLQKSETHRYISQNNLLLI